MCSRQSAQYSNPDSSIFSATRPVAVELEKTLESGFAYWAGLQAVTKLEGVRQIGSMNTVYWEDVKGVCREGKGHC